MLSSLEFHKDFSTLRIATHEIGVNGLSVNRSISKDALSALLFEENNALFSWKAETESTVCFQLSRENDHTFIVSLVNDLSLTSTCSRCLSPVSYLFSMDFSIRMLEGEHLKVDETEFEFDSFETFDSKENDLSVGYFADKCIDLGVILRDQIFFQAPDYPQCTNSDGFIGCAKPLQIIRADEDNNKSNPFVKLLKQRGSI